MSVGYPVQELSEKNTALAPLERRVAECAEQVLRVVEKANGAFTQIQTGAHRKYYAPQKFDWAYDRGEVRVVRIQPDSVVFYRLPTAGYVYKYREVVVPKLYLEMHTHELSKAVRDEIRELKNNENYVRLLTLQRKVRDLYLQKLELEVEIKKNDYAVRTQTSELARKMRETTGYAW